MERKIFKTTVGGREMSVEVGAYCGQANGSCIVRCGDTVVMVNATMAKEPREGMDYFPLSVVYVYLLRCTPWARSRRLQEERGQSERQGDPHGASYRPSHTSSVPQGNVQ